MQEPPALRSLMRLRVILPAREIEAHAMAVHVSRRGGDDPRGTGVGVEFWGLAGPDKWDDFVRELLQAQRALAKKTSASKPNRPSSSGVRAVIPPRRAASDD